MAWEVLTAPWHRSWLSPQLKRNLSLFNIASMYKWYKAFVWTLLFWGMFPGNRFKKSFHHRAPESIGIWHIVTTLFLKSSLSSKHWCESILLVNHRPSLPPKFAFTSGPACQSSQDLKRQRLRATVVTFCAAISACEKGAMLWVRVRVNYRVVETPQPTPTTMTMKMTMTMMTTMTMIMMMGARMHQRLMIRINSQVLHAQLSPNR